MLFCVGALGFGIVARASILSCGGMEPRVGGKFRLGRKIGSGSFGEIYLGLCLVFPLFCLFLVEFENWVSMWFVLFFAGTNIQTNEEVAIKLVSCFFLLNSLINL